ncbi:ATPase subunit of ABC transporter with duplicated ATPase domains [Arthrobacter sp. PvP102]|uniref:ABC-F family ATP-binding cassette domain-containing protein n=1 Tax=unclassified Arthrobacter TaxID=235627 RepID=UPI001AE6423E|nr:MULTISPECIES: ABC-F family ATP-binding cassette domain-containing protein [unclassified Arthrobacter]MBP1234728.1 ATPase subunit of ABC transporter with duplicated ATPase domains [Arthrobacter sp. PvP103]MBP1235686.1 ATPase subunit of ABC transporter with duplicated ATPase domains [Arthrobacter sp. PvP102]
MAHLLGGENLTVSYATRTVLDGVTLGLEEGDRIGMVGRNGDGKSTLMRLLAMRATPDSGRVTKRSEVNIGYLDQSDVLDGDLTVGAAIVGDQADYEWARNPQIREVMGGLVSDVDWHANVHALSGGQKRRVALAKLLIEDHDVIMLDEPTNHLDVEGVAWLSRHLKTRWRPNQGAFLVVTHDRWFLDEVCNKTWEIHDGIMDPFEGGYAAYVLARAERDRSASVMEGKRQQLVKKELAWLRRGAPARTAKPKFRIEAANALIADVPEPRDSMALSKMATARLGKDVLDLEHVSLDFLGGAPGQKLFDNITLRLAPGERLGLVGVNGAGKTTLLKLLNGEIQPTSGKLKRGKTVVTAVLTQEVKELDDVKDLRVIEVIEREKRSFNVGGKEFSAGQLVEQLGFTNEKQWTPVKDLSGGERRRLQLLRLLVGEPNVLMLDEPTNDLDTDTLAAVEDVLDGWPGTLVVVSHDRYLLERVTDHQMALLGDGKIRALPRGVDQYLELREAALAGSTITGGGNPVTAASGSAAPATSGPSEAEKRDARKAKNRIDRQLGKLTQQEEKIHAQMVKSTADNDFDAMAELNKKLKTLAEEREALELEWLEALEVLGE